MGLWVSGSTSALSALHLQIKSLPFRWLLFGHCATVASWHQDVKDHFLLHYWLCWLNGFGGGSSSALLLMNPKEAGVSIFVNNMVGIAWTTTWWAMNYAPLPWLKKVANLLPVRVLTKGCTQIMRAIVIMDRVDSSVRMFPSVIAAPLIIGTIAGCGGKFIAEMIRGGLGLPLSSSPEIVEPGQSWRSAFIGAASHYCLSHFFQILTPIESAALVITFMTSHTLVAELFSMPLDYSQPVFKALTTVSNIPIIKPSAPGTCATPAVTSTEPKPTKAGKAPSGAEKSGSQSKANGAVKAGSSNKKQN